MCRWLAYSGSPIALEAVLLEPEHSLIDQSLHSRMGVETTNGDLMLAVDPSLFSSIAGSTDSELMFYLVLSLGLNDDPVAAVERMAGLIEKTSERHGIANPLQMSLATTNGERLWVFRYSTEGQSRSLYCSTHFRTLRELYPDNARIASVSEETRFVVSEPLVDLPGAWNEVPESHCGIVQAGQDELLPFQPKP